MLHLAQCNRPLLPPCRLLANSASRGWAA
jgi:hypothetical protein